MTAQEWEALKLSRSKARKRGGVLFSGTEFEPGTVLQASDRQYIVDEHGSLRIFSYEAAKQPLETVDAMLSQFIQPEASAEPQVSRESTTSETEQMA